MSSDAALLFSRQLTDILKNHGFDQDENDTKARVSFLFDKYKNASVPITRATLKSWFEGESRPCFDSRSRQGMHRLCFVLDFDYAQVCRFFNSVYMGRSFNCRSIKEAVYCYCFSNNKDYTHACSLIKAAEKLLADPKKDAGANAPESFTNTMEEDIRALETDQEFLDYVLLNRDSFSQYNQSAIRELDRLRKRIKGTSEDQKLVNLHRKTGTKITRNDYNRLQGLAVKEYFLYHDSCQDLKSLNVASSDFMLSQMLGIHMPRYYAEEHSGRSFSKNAELVRMARINFPSRQYLSDILSEKKNAPKKISFDAVRKMLVLLHFYCFFIPYVLGENTRDYSPMDYPVYVEDANDQLASCNYGSLYEKNPYDHIFMSSAQTPYPLDTFRDIIEEAVDGA